MESYDVYVGEDLVFSGELEDAMDVIEDLSDEFYRTGEPDPSTIYMEINDGKG